jgi:hypothetical protein
MLNQQLSFRNGVFLHGHALTVDPLSSDGLDHDPASLVPAGINLALDPEINALDLGREAQAPTASRQRR